MKSIAYAILASTALALSCFAPTLIERAIMALIAVCVTRAMFIGEEPTHASR